MMKLIFLFLVVLSSIFAMQITDDPSFKKIFQQHENHNKTVLMIYSAITCPQCAYMKHKVFKDPQVSKYLKKYFTILEKDINKDDLPSEFSYFGIPTMFFINKDGKQIAKLVGSSRAKPFLEKLEKINKKAH